MRILFILISFVFWGEIEAQNLDSARHLWERNELGRALDLISKDTVSNGETWMLKAKIYQSISIDPKYKDLVADPKKEAFEALKMAFNSEYPTDLPASFTTDSTAYKIYEGYTNEGVAFFNAGTEKQDKKDYALALKSFKKAIEVWDLMYEDGSGNPMIIDTINLLNSAKAAIYGDDEPQAYYYSKKIADASFTRADFEPVYQWLLYYYRQKDDTNLLLDYTIKFSKAFPKSNYGSLNLIDFYKDKGDFAIIFYLYQGLNKNTPVYKFAYLQDIFNYLYNNAFRDTAIIFKIPSRESLTQILETGLKEYLKTNSHDVSAKLLCGKFYINKAVDKQKEKLRANIFSLLIKSNKYLKDVADRSPKADKNLKIEAVKLLIGNYKILKQPAQLKWYDKILTKLTKD